VRVPLSSANLKSPAQTSDWSRLIPGAKPGFLGQRKKPPQSARLFTEQARVGFQQQTAPVPEHKLAFLFPLPLHSPAEQTCLRSVAADFALIGLNWLAIGALLVPLRHLFPFVRSFAYAAGSPGSLLGVALLHASLLTLIGYTGGLYSAPTFRSREGFLANATFWSTGLLAAAYELEGAPWTRSALCLVAGLFHFGVLWLWRFQVERADKSSGKSSETEGGFRNVLIVGAGPVGRAIAASIRRVGSPDRYVCGLIDEGVPLGDGVIGRVADLPRLARTGFVDEVILAAPRDPARTLDILREAKRLHLDLKFVPDLAGCAPMDLGVERIGNLPLIPLHAERHPVMRLFCKRFLDILGASVALALVSPALVLIAALIVLDSPGPVFYCAPRVGRKACPFRCYKFRTMVNDADERKDRLRRINQRSGPFFKIHDDPRITRVGRFLRRYSLDELPQLWNVLRGEMSLVGPRPHPLDDFAGYETAHLARLDVTPGITGLWQVTARRDPSFDRGMELDREYIRRWSLTLDFQIMLKTLMAVIRGGGD
jgi:exopolysaccharide biosynthesis polyprenyl glycosylphosphotransferase